MRETEHVKIGTPDEEDVNPKLAVIGEPIVGMEVVTWEEGKGPGALPARPLSSPKEMTTAQRRIHDITHLPYDPGCAICVSCRRPNDHHRDSKESSRTIPLLVADYGFPKNYEDDDTLTVLIMRVYPYKLFVRCWVPGKGRDPRVVARVSRFIRETGLTHFAYRSDREPAITAMIEEACAASGRKGVKVNSDDDDGTSIQHDVMVENGELRSDDLPISDVPHGDDSLRIESTHTAAPEVSHPGESQSNGHAEK